MSDTYTPTKSDRDKLILTVRDVDADYHGTGPLALSGAEAALIADAVLASDWLSSVIATAKADALEEFAQNVDDGSIDWDDLKPWTDESIHSAYGSSGVWTDYLRKRAAAIRAAGGSDER